MLLIRRRSLLIKYTYIIKTIANNLLIVLIFIVKSRNCLKQINKNNSLYIIIEKNTKFL